ncbi:UvrD-helicase domain-containing protein [Hydrogenophaga sp. OTU3427]|uniref:UvrD-helicase domain-containing protein n=1 Tax=Hydrogenophaga sp. OTU3427 TaxID=3043856 RepID=UPI00313BEE84
MSTTPEPGAVQAAYRINGALSDATAFYRVACDPARSVAVEACAGAGKTWMLVSRILRALLAGCEPQDILAITFTKKAAGEMRQRLQEWLQQFAGLTDDALVPQLVMRGMAAEQALEAAPRLRQLQQGLLDGGRSVQVRTFHSWFAALLRAAPLAVLAELRLPVQYELLEDDSVAVRQVWPRFFGAVRGDDELSAHFHAAVATHGRSQTLKALATALSKRVEFELADAAGVVEASVRSAAQQFPELAGVDDPTQLIAHEGPQRALLWAAAQALGRASAKTFSAKGGELELALTQGHFAGVCDALLTQKAEPRKFGDKLAGIETVRDAQALVQHLRAAVAQQDAWRHQHRMAALSRALLSSYAALKRERGWVDMNDIERAALRLLADNSLAPWMQQRLDARVRQLLIDEFQDTNPLQWQALYAWLSAYAGAGAGDAPSVFLVGDPKQSIYRFRRAEPQVFRAAQQFVVQGLGGALLSCDHTRRCAPAVVGALNTVMGAAGAAGEFAGFREHSTDSQAVGSVLALPVVPRPERAAPSEDDGEVWRDSLSSPKRLPEDSLSAQEARQAADWIAQVLREDGLSPGKLMVLARKRERLGWLHEALRERGIPSEEPEKRDLADAPPVQDVVALLDVLVSSTQDLSLARALKSPLFAWDDSDLALLAQQVKAAAGPRRNWWDTLQQWAVADLGRPPERILLTAERLRRYRDAVLQLPPHDALAAIYRDADVLAAYARSTPAALRPQVLAQLQALLTQALAVDGGRCLTPYRLVRALKAGGLKAPVVATPDAVRLLTVHGAKGLEAHTVVLLDTDARPPRPQAMGVLVDWPGEAAAPRRFVFLVSEKQPPACAADLLENELAARSLEELNALYVAMTRAERRLLVSATQAFGDSGQSWLKRLLPVAQAVPVAAPHGASDPAGAQAHFSLPELPALTWTAPARGDAPPDGNPLSARIGQAMHRLLQWRPTPVASFAWTAAHVSAVGREFELDPMQARQALAMAEAITRGEGAWAWDAAHIDWWDNEVELLDAQGQLQRLDRLVRERASGQWWVLDHKSASQPQQQAGLREQLARYAEAVRLAWPGAVVRTAFLTADGRCIELPVPDASARPAQASSKDLFS